MSFSSLLISLLLFASPDFLLAQNNPAAPPQTEQQNGQFPVPNAPQTANPPPTTNEGTPFKDPFEDGQQQQQQQAPAEQPQTEQAPGSTTPDQTSPDMNQTSPTNPSLAATPAPTPAPAFQTPELSQPGQPGEARTPPQLPAPPPPTPAPEKNFQFPEVDQSKGPISQEIYKREQNENEAHEGQISISADGGAGVNLNRRYQQVHLEGKLGYRSTKEFEVAISTYYRFVTDRLVGFMLHGAGDYRITHAPNMRIDWMYGAGLGWTLRAPHTKFTEGRMALRAETSVLFYPYSWFALYPSIAVESFLFGITSTGQSENLFSHGGPPTQGIATLGARFEF